MIFARTAWPLLLTMILSGAPFVSVAAQTDTVKTLPGIEITTGVDSATVYIGDLITYTITITYDSTYELIPPPLGANLGAFDVKDYQPDHKTVLKDGRTRNETVFKLSTFTTGDYVIPPVPISFVLRDRTRKTLLAEPVPIRVQSLLLNTSDSVDIKPNKPQFEFERKYLKYILWGIAALVLVAANLLIWWWLKRRRALSAVEDRRAPWEIAFAELARLEQKNLLTAGKFKEFYFELTEISRTYLGKMFDAEVLEMTTEEFLERFRDVELPGGTYDLCAALFRHADLVKFAKLEPQAERGRSDFDTVHRLVDDVRRFVEAKRAAEIAASHTPPSPVQTSGGAHG